MYNIVNRNFQHFASLLARDKLVYLTTCEDKQISNALGTFVYDAMGIRRHAIHIY